MTPLRFNKAERAALDRALPNELERLARTMKSDAYYAYLDGRSARSKELNRKAAHFATVAIRKAK